jgi:hypothetical protein
MNKIIIVSFVERNTNFEKEYQRKFLLYVSKANWYF